MEKTMKILDFIQSHKEVKRIVIQDNAYLPFIDIKELLEDMKVGQILAFPMKKRGSVKVIAKRIENESDCEYRCCRNDVEKTYDVCRFL